MPLVTTNEMLKKSAGRTLRSRRIQRGKYGNGHGGY